VPTAKKQEAVEVMREMAEKSAGIYLAEYKGLSVKDVSLLRRAIAKQGAEMVVIKNRLFKLAVDGTPAQPLVEYMTGPNAAIFCLEDGIAPAKTIQDFARTHEVVKWKGGFVEGSLIDAKGMVRIAELPSKPEILAGVVGAVAGPVNGFVGLLGTLVSDLVFTLEAVADKRQAAG
jgi:large subunit ribosomal protein L10